VLRGIDHLVVAVADLDAAAEELAARVGLSCTAGGSHPGAGTANRIAFLGEAYLELIGVEDEQLAAQRPIGAAVLRALESGGGLATFALVDDDLEATVPRLGANGSGIGQVTHGSRARPDGELVEWWTATFEQLGAERPPFLIRHALVGVEWGAGALDARRGFVHPIGSPAVLAGLDIPTAEPVALAAAYADELDLEFRMVGSIAVADVGRHVLRLVPGEAASAATVLIGTDVPAHRSVEALGLRFELQPATQSLATS
jgi:hypothetical protein